MATKKSAPRKSLESQFAALMKEVSDLRRRIEAIERQLESPPLKDDWQPGKK